MGNQGSNGVSVDVILDNKTTKVKLLESKEEYSRVLKEQIAEKDKF